MRPVRGEGCYLISEDGSRYLDMAAGIAVVKKDVPFVMANGHSITRHTGYGIVRVGEFETARRFSRQRGISQRDGGRVDAEGARL